MDACGANRSDAEQLAALDLHPVADTQVVDALVVEPADAAVVEAHADAVDLVGALVALLDVVADHRAADGAEAGGRRAAAAAADLVADHGAQHRADDRAAAGR